MREIRAPRSGATDRRVPAKLEKAPLPLTRDQEPVFNTFVRM